MLSDLAGWARDLVVAAGYIGVFLAMVVENVFPPIPSEVVLPLAGFETARGELGFAGVIFSATLGSLVGALILYVIGRYGGRPVIDRWGSVLRVTDREISSAEGWFDRWGTWVVLVARVVPLARSVVSIPAGMSRMPWGRFIALTTIGSLAWNLLLVGAGNLLGTNWEQVSEVVGRSSDVILIVAVVAVLGAGFWLFRRRRTTP